MPFYSTKLAILTTIFLYEHTWAHGWNNDLELTLKKVAPCHTLPFHCFLTLFWCKKCPQKAQIWWRSEQKRLLTPILPPLIPFDPFWGSNGELKVEKLKACSVIVSWSSYEIGLTFDTLLLLLWWIAKYKQSTDDWHRAYIDSSYLALLNWWPRRRIWQNLFNLKSYGGMKASWNNPGYNCWKTADFSRPIV